MRIHKPAKRNTPWWVGSVTILAAVLACQPLMYYTLIPHAWPPLKLSVALFLMVEAWWLLLWFTIPKQRDVNAMEADPEYAEYRRLRRKFSDYRAPKQKERNN